MKIAQLILSVIGLVSILLAYVTGRIEFLIIALAAFVGGLYYMGAIGRRTATQDQDSDSSQANAKDKSQKQQ